MNYNLTTNQKELAKWILSKHQENKLPETFEVGYNASFGAQIHKWHLEDEITGQLKTKDVTLGSFEALVESGLLQKGSTRTTTRTRGSTTYAGVQTATFTMLGALEKAVESKFAEEPVQHLSQTPTFSHLPEITMSLERLRAKYPDSKRLGFIIMRFAAEKPYERIVQTIKKRQRN